jgi:hypothetical protein
MTKVYSTHLTTKVKIENTNGFAPLSSQMFKDYVRETFFFLFCILLDTV